MRKAFVHIGAHKTASSFLQANLNLQCERLLADHDLALVTRADLKPSAFGKEIYEVSQNNLPAGEMSDAAKDSLTSLLPAGGNVLITNEDLICQLGIEDFYQHAEQAIQYLCTALVDFDVHVIFYIRRQTDYLESIYMQLVHLGRRLKFHQFLKRAETVDLSWLEPVLAMERTLPPGRLHLRAFEQIRQIGEDEFFRDFLRICQLDDADDYCVDKDFAKGRPANRSYGQLAMQMAHRVNPLLNPKEKKLMRRFLQEHFSTATHPRAVLLGEEQRDAMFERYKASNQQVFERWDLGASGEKLGYF
jgi:hypothetical protein